MVQAVAQPADYVPGPTKVQLRLTPSAAAPTPPKLFLVQVPRVQSDYVQGPSLIFLPKVVFTAPPTIYVIQGKLQIVEAVGPPTIYAPKPLLLPAVLKAPFEQLIEQFNQPLAFIQLTASATAPTPPSLFLIQGKLQSDYEQGKQFVAPPPPPAPITSAVFALFGKLQQEYVQGVPTVVLRLVPSPAPPPPPTKFLLRAPMEQVEYAPGFETVQKVATPASTPSTLALQFMYWP